jgi:hypothetical protein
LLAKKRLRKFANPIVLGGGIDVRHRPTKIRLVNAPPGEETFKNFDGRADGARKRIIAKAQHQSVSNS